MAGMEATCSTKTLVDIQQTTWCYISEDIILIYIRILPHIWEVTTLDARKFDIFLLAIKHNFNCHTMQLMHKKVC
jgi:hypothetical protein